MWPVYVGLHAWDECRHVIATSTCPGFTADVKLFRRAVQHASGSAGCDRDGPFVALLPACLHFMACLSLHLPCLKPAAGALLLHHSRA